MRFIEDFRNRHAGEEIWIVGSGPSLDDFPDDFFYGRISIALNYAIIAFPKCTYWSAGHPETILEMKKDNPQVLKKSILLFPMVPFKKDYPKRMSEERALELLGEYKDDPAWMRWHWIHKNRHLLAKFLPSTIDAIMAGKSCNYVCFGTIAHYATQAAVVLGAKKVTLVGCEAKTGKYFWHAQKRGLSRFYHEGRREYTREHMDGKARKFPHNRLGTKLLAEAFKPHGIQVRRYFYGIGYEEIIE